AIGSVHFLGIYASVVNASRFHFDPKDAAEIRIQRVTEEGKAAGPSQTFSDRAAIRDGLSRLASARAFWRNHEHFLDGYRIEIVIPGAPERFLSVYRRSSNGRSVSIVIPHFGVTHGGTISNGGVYDCPGFHQWARERVDPLFASTR